MPVIKNHADVKDDLTRLLLKAVPPNVLGNKTLTHLASLMGVSKWAVRKWIIQQRIPPARVNRIVELSRIEKHEDFTNPENPKAPVTGAPRVKHEDFGPFVYNV